MKTTKNRRVKKKSPSERPHGKCISTDEAVTTRKQHVRPCSDCPFLRNAMPGWLGGHTIDQFVMGAHHGAVMDCHTRKKPLTVLALADAELDTEIYGQESQHWQCAGVAVYRANLCKRPRPGEGEHLLQGDKDTTTVFANPTEFIQHHSGIKNVQDPAKPARQATRKRQART